MQAVLARIADLARRRPWAVLAGSAVLLAAAVPVAVQAPDELGIGSSRLTDAPAPGTPRDAELVVVLTGAGVSPEDRVFRAAERVVRAQIAADPAVDRVTRAPSRGEVAMVLRFDAGASGAERQRAAIRLEDSIDPGSLGVRIEGEVARLLDARRDLSDDLWRPELLVLPLALLIVAAAAAPRRMAAPVLCAALAVVGSLALLRLGGLVADISLLGFAAAAAVGLVLGVEIPLLELRGRDAATAGWMALAAALPPLALLATPFDQAASLALGCALAAAIAAVAAIVLVPATIAAFEPSAGPAAPRGAVAAVGAAPPRFGRFARAGRSPVVAAAGAALATVALGVVAWPSLDGDSSPFGLPGATEADSIFDELPIPAAIVVGVCALVFLTATRRTLAPALAPLPVLVAAAGIGASVFVFEQGNLLSTLDFLDSERQPSLDTAAVAIAACVLASIAAARTVGALAAWPGRSVEDDSRLSRASLHASIAGTLVGALAAGAMLATDLYPARELGLALAIGLLLDLVLVRVALLGLARRWIG